MSNIQLRLLGKQIVDGKQFNGIVGGFGKGKRAVLAKDIAEIHSRELHHINEAINNNRKRFADGVDIIDLAIGVDQTDTYEMLLGLGFTKQSLGSVKGKGGNIYLLSERGYAKLLKILEDDTAWKMYELIVDGYFQMKEHQIVNPSTLRLKEEETKIKAINAQARLMNAQVRQSRFILEEADKRKLNLSPESYELLQINGFEAVIGKNVLPRPKLETEYYDLGTIAEKVGLFSTSKLPHAQAVGAILSKLAISESERLVTAFDRNGHQGSTYQYTPSILAKVKEWLSANGNPAEIPYVDSKGGAKTYKVTYGNLVTR